MVETINTWQAIQQKWESGVVAPEERTPTERFTRMMEEVKELAEAIDETDGTIEKQLDAGFEAADVIIIALGVIDALGLDAERLINEKMDINFHKYNPVENGRLRSNGLNHRQARDHQKSIWIKPNG